MDSVQLLKLEVSDSSLFGDVSKLRVYKDRIYVLDRRFAKALFIFDRNGKLIRKIQNQGRGPKEFLSIFNFEIVYSQNQLLLVDNWGRKLGFFDLEGNCLRVESSKIEVLNVGLLPGGAVVHAKSESNSWKNGKPKGSDKIFYTTEEGKILKSAFSYNDNADIHFGVNNVLLMHPDTTLTYAPRFRDTIYYVTEDTLIPRYALAFKQGQEIDHKILLNSRKKEIVSLVEQGKDCFLGEHMESDSYLYLEINFWENLYGVFYNKQTGKSIAVKAWKNPLIIPAATDGDYFWTFLNYDQAMHYSHLWNNVDSLNLQAEDNPYLVRYKLK